MAKEIERKWLIDPENLPDLKGREYYTMEQGYIANGDNVVRVRKAGPHGWLTVKGMNKGLVRPEFEYRIPWEDAREMLDTMCVGDIIVKKRYNIPYGEQVMKTSMLSNYLEEKYLIELDIFQGENEGLIIAEVEFESEEDANSFEAPEWFGEDVSEDYRYTNASLAKKNYKQILEDKRWEGYECHGNCIHRDRTTYCRDCGPDNYKYEPYYGFYDDDDEDDDE